MVTILNARKNTVIVSIRIEKIYANTLLHTITVVVLLLQVTIAKSAYVLQV
jgi:hypothetical protein